MSSTPFWKDTEDNEPPLPQGLANILTEVADLDKQTDKLKAEMKRIVARRSRLEEMAVEEMASSGLDGVKAAGRSWRVEPKHHLSVPTDRRDETLEAARQMGIKTETLVSISTGRLRAELKEAAERAGRDTRRPYSEGTPMDGVVSEYVQQTLCHLTLPKKGD